MKDAILFYLGFVAVVLILSFLFEPFEKNNKKDTIAQESKYSKVNY